MEKYQQHLILLLLWLSYYAIHSMLASLKTKDFVAGISPHLHKYYRLYYSIFSILSLLPVLYVQMTVPFVKLVNGSFLFRPIAFLLSASGIIFLKRAFKEYSLKSFLGLSSSKESSDLKRTGLLSIVRHPIYTGTILIFLGYLIFSLSLSGLTALVALVIYLPFGIYFEERKLIHEFGDKYQVYKQEVPAIIPKIRF